MNIILIGFMGTGKSTVGRLLAGRLGYDYLDTDQMIEERVGQRIPEIFAVYGEAGFRAHEQQLAEEIAKLDRKVVSTGGGFVLAPENVKLLRENGFFIALTATPETILERVKQDVERPLLQVPDPLKKIQQLLAQRNPVYRQADLVLDTTAKEPIGIMEELVPQILSRGVFINGRSED